MKLCVFQGTFNPIHNAHIRVGCYISRRYDFDKILFIPASVPPHKDCGENLAQHRLNMVKLALENFPQFKVSDIEYKRAGKSYTYLTICELYNEFQIEGKISFIIGTDAFEHIESWYEADKLKGLVKFIVFVRENNFNKEKFDYLKTKGYDFEFEELPFEDVSSTRLRDMIKSGEPIDNYVTKAVKDYIIENELYKC